ncbi:unnamed protein product [Miscanthus lutarioriparius]|uniref:Retrotransposon gag domain-containing protein n=1 Tax=Miscanthus lutarioriparius TaxID=422564 RepID=A0A811MH92_9POAL|nr:unnamed protein product [Miscanthus lutarioriparius]
MEPSLKQILDALNARFDEFDRRLDDRDRAFADRTGSVDSHFATLETSISTQAIGLEKGFEGIESRLPDPVSVSVEQRLTSLEASFAVGSGHRHTTLEPRTDVPVKPEFDPRAVAFEKVSADPEARRPGVDAVLGDIHKDVPKLVQTLDRQVFDDSSHRSVVLHSPPAATALAQATGLHATPPSGHRVDLTPRDAGSGVVTTWTHVPANGMLPEHHSHHFVPDFRPPPAIFHPRPAPDPVHHPPSHLYHPLHYPIPIFSTDHSIPSITLLTLSSTAKLPFPTFDGVNPKRWRSLCEKYFLTCVVDPSIWISLVEHYMEGPAAIWYQSIAPQLPSATWESFCQMLHERFDRDQHEHLLRQMFSIRQHTSVSAYVTAFSQLVDQLISYSPRADPLFYTQCFIDGLRSDIRAVILVQRPQTFDAVVRLALLQEEVATAPNLRVQRGGDWSTAVQPRLPAAAASPLPLPQPPPRADKAVAPIAAASVGANVQTTTQTMAAVKAYRRALGLCFKCNAKWSKDHVYAPEVLHAVALWESFSSEDSLADSVEEFPPSEQCCLALSKSAFPV